MFEQFLKLALVAAVAAIAITLSKGFKDMANLTDAQVTRIETAINNLGTDIKKTVADLQSGSGDTPALLARLDAAGQALEDLDLTVKADDPTPIVPPVTP